MKVRMETESQCKRRQAFFLPHSGRHHLRTLSQVHQCVGTFTGSDLIKSFLTQRPHARRRWPVSTPKGRICAPSGGSLIPFNKIGIPLYRTSCLLNVPQLRVYLLLLISYRLMFSIMVKLQYASAVSSKTYVLQPHSSEIATESLHVMSTNRVVM